MRKPTQDQITLYKKMKEIIKDELFFRAMMEFALNGGCERELIEAIDAGELAEEQDFYQLLDLIFEESQEESEE